MTVEYITLIHTIMAYTDEAYKDFKCYAIRHGFDEQTIKDYFYNVVVP